MAEQFISKFDGTTSDNLLDVINKNQGVFPFDTELNETSSKGLPNSVIAREINAIKDATSNNKGYFLTEEALMSIYPSANEGSKAYVGKNYPYKIYLYQNGLWTDSGQTGGDDSFNAGEFYTKTQIDQQHKAINNEISRVEKGANYEVLEYEVNIATTRLKVKENNRKGGYMITYNPGTGWIKEQYIGTAVTNEEWIKDENWKAEVLDENIQAIAENAQQQADLAANNAALAQEKANEASTQAAFAKEQGDRLSSIDLSLYRVVIELPSIPSMSDDDMNKIYLKVSAKQGKNNKYDEFVVVDGIWELLGQYEAAIDLTDYVGKDELSSEIAVLPELENISKFVCIDENGEAAGVMTKEQVAEVVGELIGKATSEKDGLFPKELTPYNIGKVSPLNFNDLINLFRPYASYGGTNAPIGGAYYWGIYNIGWNSDHFVQIACATLDTSFIGVYARAKNGYSGFTPWRTVQLN